MAHMLEIVDGKAKMFSVQKTPWHGLGVILDQPPNSEEAIIAAGLDWTVEKRQAKYICNIDNSVKDLPKHYAVIRSTDGSCLGHAGETWQALQNKDAFKFFDPYVQAGEATYETAGSLENGKRIWVLAKIKSDPMEIIKGDTVEKYILLANHHTGGYAVTGMLTPIRVVCNNTLTGALMRSTPFKATHSNRMIKRLEDIQADIATADKAFMKTAEYYRQFAKKQVTEKDIKHFLSMTFQWSSDSNGTKREESFKQKQTDTIMRLFETGRGSDIKGVNGTLWGLYNAVTEFTAHEKGKDNESRLKNNWFGGGMHLNKRAYEAALVIAA